MLFEPSGSIRTSLRRAQPRPWARLGGTPALPPAAAYPWDYVPTDETETDHEAQARCYRAFFGAWSDALVRPGTGALGFNCYFWDPYHRGGAADTGYGIRGKPALGIIRQGFDHIRQATSRAPTP